MRLLVALLVLTPSLAGQVHIDGFLGGAHTTDGPLTISQPSNATSLSLRGVSYEGRSFEGPLYYGARAGAHISPHIALEGEFIHLKVFAKTAENVAAQGTQNGAPIAPTAPLGSVIERFQISHGANLLLVNAIYRQPLSSDDEERAFMTGRAGLGTMLAHPETTIGGASREGYELGGFAWQVSGGIELRLWPHVYALGEYKFTRAKAELDIADGTVEPRLSSHHVIFGIGFKF